MGTSYGLNAKTGRWALDCGQCGVIGGVRKRHCPAGWCPAAQLCSSCLATIKADGRWADWHKDCQASSDAYAASEAAKDAEPHAWARAAWGDWDDETPTGMVRVLTRAGTTVFVKADDYHGGSTRLPAYALV